MSAIASKAMLSRAFKSVPLLVGGTYSMYTRHVKSAMTDVN